MVLNGETRLFPIIGDPIAQVRSPEFLGAILERRGANAIVPPLQVKPADLADTVRVLKRGASVHGILATVPHKVAMLEHADELSERAAFVGSVNILCRRAGCWVADNVDGVGYVTGIRHEGFEVAGQQVLLVGVGGAGAAVALEFLQQGAALLAIHDLNTQRRDSMIQRLQDRFPGRVTVGSDDPGGFDLVANVTPVGMRDGDPYPVTVEKLQARQFVAEAITKPAVSPLIAYARELGCRTMVGAGMFNAQAEILVDFMLETTQD
ncbi:MAG: hypothetical protein R3E89_07450 [Thiolinea sp.]